MIRCFEFGLFKVMLKLPYYLPYISQIWIISLHIINEVLLLFYPPIIICAYSSCVNVCYIIFFSLFVLNNLILAFFMKLYPISIMNHLHDSNTSHNHQEELYITHMIYFIFWLGIFTSLEIFSMSLRPVPWQFLIFQLFRHNPMK